MKSEDYFEQLFSDGEILSESWDVPEPEPEPESESEPEPESESEPEPESESEPEPDSSDNPFPPGLPMCPKCNTPALKKLDGCMTCLNCGDSKCGF